MAADTITSPSTGEPVADLTRHSSDDFARAVAAARAAQPAWAATAPRERAAIIRRLSRAVSERQAAIADLISACTGKTRTDAIAGEVAPIGMAAEWYARDAVRMLRPKRVRRGHRFFALVKRSYIVREPLGVVGIISPWNYPFGIPMHEIIMALVTGNAVVLKVATQVQPVGDMMVSLVRSVGVPADLMQLVHLPGRDAGTAFLEAGIDKLQFTGSVAVGKELASAAGARLLPVGLELGGNDAMIVLSDAPLERAVNGAPWAGLSNAGQSCGGVERIIVEEPLYDRFAARLADRVRSLRVGPDHDHETDVGSLTTEAQAQTTAVHVEDAIAKGARILAESPIQPGTPENGIFHRVVVLEGVNDTMDVVRHETFGPVLTLERARDADDAVRKANASYLGLSASVWTTSRRRGREIASRIEAGSIAINDHLMQHGMAETPWGGYKESSVGRTHGRIGLEAMTSPKVVVESRFRRAVSQIWWLPNGPRAYAVVSSILPVLYGPNRLRAVARVVPAFLRSLFGPPK